MYFVLLLVRAHIQVGGRAAERGHREEEEGGGVCWRRRGGDGRQEVEEVQGAAAGQQSAAAASHRLILIILGHRLRQDDDHRVPGGHVGVDAAAGVRLGPLRPPRRRQGRSRVLRQDQAEVAGEQVGLKDIQGDYSGRRQSPVDLVPTAPAAGGTLL